VNIDPFGNSGGRRPFINRDRTGLADSPPNIVLAKISSGAPLRISLLENTRPAFPDPIILNNLAVNVPNTDFLNQA